MSSFGILRKNVDQRGNSEAQTPEAKAADLLVFGYACKIFRDDEKAKEIDQGKHLIPWMSDNSLKIDRYDVRGALCDLTPHEAPPGGYGNRLDYLTSEEQRAEQLCEEERYFYLFRNEEEEILYQEEDMKRHKHGYSQVGFQYDENTEDAIQHGPSNEKQSLSPTNGSEQPFELPPYFELPPSIELPKTIKQHAIIEKTARFIMTQGAQMEILIKAKQSNNLQFEFLNQNSILNPYYKEMLNALRNGSYPTETDPLPESSDDVASQETNRKNEMEEEILKPQIIVPTIKYKPSANCAYTQLISKIKGTPLPPADLCESSSSPKIAGLSCDQLASSVETPITMEYNSEKCNVNESKNDSSTAQVTVLKSSNALMLAQCYSSDTDTEGEKEGKNGDSKTQIVGELNLPIPPDYLQNIIDKTAGYVIKNGRQFEETLRTKNDERFTFLWHDNEYYPYYMYKITGDPYAAKKEEKNAAANRNNVKSASVKESDIKKEKVVGPVCFSIKTRDDTSSVCSIAISEDGSDADDHSQSQKSQLAQNRTVPEHVQKAIKLVESQLMARNAQMGIHSHNTTGTISSNTVIPSVKSRFDIDQTGTVAAPKTTALFSNVTLIPSVTNAISSRNATPYQQNQQKFLKRAEDKVKDKLAQIAREKLGGLLSKEKQLQFERKRKAMAFLNQIKGTPTGSPSSALLTSTTDDNNSVKPQMISKDGSDSDDLSVHSIPISSYGGDDDKTDDDITLAPIASPVTSSFETHNDNLKFKRSPPAHDIKSASKRLKRESSREISSQISMDSNSGSFQARVSRHHSSKKKLKHKSYNSPDMRSSKNDSKSRSPSISRKKRHRLRSYSSDRSPSYRHRSRSLSTDVACSSHSKSHKRSSSRKHKKRRKHRR